VSRCKNTPKERERENEQAAAELVRVNGNYAREHTVDPSKTDIRAASRCKSFEPQRGEDVRREGGKAVQLVHVPLLIVCHRSISTSAREMNERCGACV